MALQTSAYAKLSVLLAGSLTMPVRCLCDDHTDESARLEVPSLSFLIQHPSGFTTVFDLGMRKDWCSYAESIRTHIVQKRLPVQTNPDVGDSLRRGGQAPSDIDAVIFSHIHYDHVGTPRDFTKAHFIVGYGTQSLIERGVCNHSGTTFEKDLLPDDRIVELPPPDRPLLPDEPPSDANYPHTKSLQSLIPSSQSWQRFGNVLDNALDLFGDGLVYLVDSPGHIVGHLNLLVRVSAAQWVYLAGDACHHPRVLHGQAGIAMWHDRGRHICLHVDKARAEATLRTIQRLREQGLDGAQVEVVLAHDGEWLAAHQDSIWPSVLDNL